jgi:5,10-methylenetetrahydromethanopterin reductase
MVIGSSVAPEHLASAAQLSEDVGFGQLWLAEDSFFTGGVAGANIVLGATSTIRVGLGIVSAVVRHPALLAMEIATTARAHPGRFVPGIGLGVPAWMRQMDLMPRSPLTAVRECVDSVRRLLEGEEVTARGEVFSFDRVHLTYPPSDPIPLYLGVIGEKMLELSGEVADGSILSVAAGVDYIGWARRCIDVGRQRAGRTDEHHLTVFAIYALDDDSDRAKEAARRTLGFYKAAGGRNALTDVAGISDELEALVTAGGVDGVIRGLPDSWVEQLTVSGDASEVVEKIGLLRAAGADSVALFPAQGGQVDDLIERTAAVVLPSL